jgi:hypothetical protein
LLIYHDESGLAAVPPAELEKAVADMKAFTSELRQQGKLLAADRLRPTATATSVRVRDGKRLITDGPFAETKEQLGGFYMIEAADLDEAVAVAGRVPAARWGTLEVRPIWEM